MFAYLNTTFSCPTGSSLSFSVLILDTVWVSLSNLIHSSTSKHHTRWLWTSLYLSPQYRFTALIHIRLSACETPSPSGLTCPRRNISPLSTIFSVLLCVPSQWMAPPPTGWPEPRTWKSSLILLSPSPSPTPLPPRHSHIFSGRIKISWILQKT